MAITSNGSTIYFQATPETMFSYPFTINFWGRLASGGVKSNFVTLHNTSDSYRFAIFTNTSDQLTLSAVDSGGNTDTSATTTSVITNTWFMGTGVFTSATSRTIYLNGTDATTGTTSRTPTTPTRILLFADYTGAVSVNCSGIIGEVAVWDAALTSSDVASLYTTAKASLIRPSNLQIYYPLFRTATAIVNVTGKSTTVNNNTRIFAHHRRYG